MGIAPWKLFTLRLKVLSAIIEPILLGIVLDKELWLKPKCRSDVNPTIETGILPCSKLLANWRFVRDRREPIKRGIVPENSLEARFMLVILLDQLTILFGMLPDKELPAMSK